MSRPFETNWPNPMTTMSSHIFFLILPRITLWFQPSASPFWCRCVALVAGNPRNTHHGSTRPTDMLKLLVLWLKLPKLKWYFFFLERYGFWIFLYSGQHHLGAATVAKCDGLRGWSARPPPSPPVFSSWDGCEAALLICLPLSYLLFYPQHCTLSRPPPSLFSLHAVVTPPAKLHRRLLLLISGISLAVSPSAPLCCAASPPFSLSPSHLSLSLSHHSRLGVFHDAFFLLLPNVSFWSFNVAL